MDSERLQNIRSRTIPYDSADYLTTKRHMAAYLEAALEEGDPSMVPGALGSIVRAHGLNQVDIGLSPDAIAVALSEAGNPSLTTFLKVVQGLGLELKVRAHRS